MNTLGGLFKLNIPMSSPDLTDLEIHAINGVLQTPYLSLGPQVDAFEKACAHYIGAQYAVAVNSGTSGLHLCVIAAGVGEGDFVITTPFSFVASANCVLYERAVPIFVDVDPLTGNIDPALVAACAQDLCHGGQAASRWLPPALRSQPYSSRASGRLKALLPVHAFGQPADLDPLLEVAHQHDLVIIEDACEAIGAQYKERSVGAMGAAGVFAFYPNKQMTTGEGGLIVTNEQTWNNLFRSLRNQGRDVFDAWLNHTRLGYNYRMDEMSAALGLEQIGRIDELLEKRQQVAGWYTQRLSDCPWLITPQLASTTTRMSWFVYVIRLKSPARRDSIMSALATHGIPSRPYFTPIHLQPFYCEKFGYQRGDFPVTEALGDISLALPFSGVMTESQVDYVCTHLMSAVSV